MNMCFGDLLNKPNVSLQRTIDPLVEYKLAELIYKRPVGVMNVGTTVKEFRLNQNLYLTLLLD